MGQYQDLLWTGIALLRMWIWEGLLDSMSGHLIFLLQQSSAPAINFLLDVSEKQGPVYSA